MKRDDWTKLVKVISGVSLLILLALQAIFEQEVTSFWNDIKPYLQIEKSVNMPLWAWAIVAVAVPVLVFVIFYILQRSMTRWQGSGAEIFPYYSVAFSGDKKDKRGHLSFDTFSFEYGETKFLDILVDASIYTGEERFNYKEQIKNYIRSGKQIPTKYLYWTEEGCKLWLDICKRGEYTYYRNSLTLLRRKAFEIAQAIVSSIGSNEIDFVSLGCGDGYKDLLLLKAFVVNLKSDEFIYYYPIDISESMIVEAIRTVAHSSFERDKVKIKAVVGDITLLPLFKPIYNFRTHANLFSLLGNTLGNNSEQEMFESLYNAMSPGDLVLLEVGIGKNPRMHSALFDVKGHKVSYKYIPQGSIPLMALGIPFSLDEIRYEVRKGISMIPDTITTVAYYDNVVLDGNRFSNIKLSSVHQYNPDRFREFVEQRLEVETIIFETESNVAILLAQRH